MHFVPKFPSLVLYELRDYNIQNCCKGFFSSIPKLSNCTLKWDNSDYFLKWKIKEDEECCLFKGRESRNFIKFANQIRNLYGKFELILSYNIFKKLLEWGGIWWSWYTKSNFKCRDGVGKTNFFQIQIVTTLICFSFY